MPLPLTTTTPPPAASVFCMFYFSVLEIKPKAQCMLGKHSNTDLLHLYLPLGPSQVLPVPTNSL